MHIDEAIEKFLQHRRDRNRSPETITQYGYHLKTLWLTWLTSAETPHQFEAITLDRMVAYFSYLTNEHRNQHRQGTAGLSPETVSGAWRTQRAFWNFCYRRDWITAKQVEWFKSDEFIARPHVPTRVRPVLEDDLLSALMDACQKLDNPERARNRAMVLMLAQSGMRISELTSMRLSRMRLEERAAIIIGKGRREEWVFWNVEAGNAVQLYLNVRCSQDDQLWRRTSGLAMTPYDVRQEIIKLEQAAGIELPEGATVHCFRHRFAHKAIDSGLDVTQTSQLMRHRDIATTMRYLRENKERLKTIHSRIKA